MSTTVERIRADVTAPLFASFDLAGLGLPNRIVVSP